MKFLPIVSVFETDCQLGIQQNVRFVGDLPVANDIAQVLGFKDPANAVHRNVSKKNKKLVKILTADGKFRSVMVLEEQGVYELVFRSRKGIAKAFKEWVFEEVLPAIRRTGYYSMQPAEYEEYVYDHHTLRFYGNKVVGIDLGNLFAVPQIEKVLTRMNPDVKDIVIIKTPFGDQQVVVLTYDGMLELLSGVHPTLKNPFICWLHDVPLKGKLKDFSNGGTLSPHETFSNIFNQILNTPDTDFYQFIREARSMRDI